MRRHDLPTHTKEGVVIKHDQLCERSSTLSAISGSFGPSKGCKCASRAWLRDPLPDDVTPIYADPKTPGQEGG